MAFVAPALRREVFGWYSERLGMKMPIVRYGSWGRPLLLLPTASGDFLEAERMYLIKSLEPLMLAGRVTVFSIDSINPWSWMNDSLPIGRKARNHALFSSYVEEEVVPHIRNVLQNGSARIGVTGASFGAFYAANSFFRRPDLFDTLIAMSGFFDLAPGYLGGYHDENVYFNNPTEFVPNIPDGRAMDLIRHSQIHIVSGRGAWERPDKSEAFSRVLSRRGIAHNLELWGHDVNHDWPWWRKMLPHYVENRLGW